MVPVLLPTGAVVGREDARDLLAMAPLTGVFVMGVFVVGVLPLAGRTLVLVGVAPLGVVFVGVVLEGEDDNDVTDFGFTGRSPLVDLLKRSETGAVHV